MAEKLKKDLPWTLRPDGSPSIASLFLAALPTGQPGMVGIGVGLLALA